MPGSYHRCCPPEMLAETPGCPQRSALWCCPGFSAGTPRVSAGSDPAKVPSSQSALAGRQGCLCCLGASQNLSSVFFLHLHSISNCCCCYLRTFWWSLGFLSSAGRRVRVGCTAPRQRKRLRGKRRSLGSTNRAPEWMDRHLKIYVCFASGPSEPARQGSLHGRSKQARKPLEKAASPASGAPHRLWNLAYRGASCIINTATRK